MLEGGGERVLRRAGDRPSQDLQHGRAGLHVDRRARGHRTDGLAAHGGLAVRDLAKVDDRQLLTAGVEEWVVDDRLIDCCPAGPDFVNLKV